MACKDTPKCPPEKKPVAKKQPTSTEFILHAPDATEVFLAGDFNNWDPKQYPMRKFKTGDCTKKLKLKAGRYEYQFIVDGTWRTDPANPQRNRTEFGSENSVIFIGDNACKN